MLMIKKNTIYRFGAVLIFSMLLMLTGSVFTWFIPAPESMADTPVPKAERDKLVVVTRNDLQGYYIYREEPVGFEYELALAFADYLGMELQMVAGGGWDEMQELLLDGRADIIAGIPNNPAKNELFSFSSSYITTKQVPVTNKTTAVIESIADFSGREVAVAFESPFQDTLDALRGQGIELYPYYYRDKTYDDFVRGVASGEYDVTLIYEYVANNYSRHYPNLRVGMVLDGTMELSWAVASDNTDLLARINAFMGQMQADGSLERLYNKYFGIQHDHEYNELETFHRRVKKNIPLYMTSIRNSAYQHGFDWRIIAAMIYQESQFNPNAVSYYGASGLMQLMPKTAESMGLSASQIYDPGKNIAAGVKYLKRMWDLFDGIEDETDRLKFALAAYNAGIGHVLDARKLAEDNGMDKDLWDNAHKMLLLLNKKEYYSKVKYGYCNGSETSTYVNNVMIYYDILKYQGSNFNVVFEFIDEGEDLAVDPLTEEVNTGLIAG